MLRLRKMVVPSLFRSVFLLGKDAIQLLSFSCFLSDVFSVASVRAELVATLLDFLEYAVYADALALDGG